MRRYEWRIDILPGDISNFFYNAKTLQNDRKVLPALERFPRKFASSKAQLEPVLIHFRRAEDVGEESFSCKNETSST